MKKQFIILLVSLFFVNFAVAQEDAIDSKNYVLCINSYTDSSPWSNQMISRITEYLQQDPAITLYAEHMNMLLVENDTILNEFRDSIFSRYAKHAPRMLVLLGNSALILRDEYREIWGDIPIVLCSQESYVGPNDTYIHKAPVKPADRTPISELTDPYNMVLLYANPCLKESIRLMDQMLPDMKKLIYIGDGRQVNQENNALIAEELKTNYPDIEYQFLSSEHITTNQLLDSLYYVNPQTTGILFGSWFYKYNFAGNTLLSANSHKIITTVSVPIFALNFVDLTDDKEGVVGGYTYDQEFFQDKLIQTISDILKGKPARDIPDYIPVGGKPVINYDQLVAKGLSPSVCPAGTLFLNKPPTFWEQYRYFILGTFVAILLLTLFFLYRIRNLNELKKAQGKEIELMTTYKTLVNNMPLLYMQKELITDENGNPVDLIYRNVNSEYER